MTQFNNIPPDIAIQAQNNLQSGLISGGVISINGGDNTKFDVTEGVGYIVDDTVDPDNPVNDRITWASQTVAVNMGNVGTRASSIVAVDINGNIVLKSSVDDIPQIFRNHIILGSVVHPTQSIITGTSSIAFGGPSISVPANFTDLAWALGAVKRRGHKLSSVSGQLQFQVSKGQTFFLGANIHNSNSNPNYFISNAQNPAFFIYVWRNGSGGFSFSAPTSTLNPTKYDDGTGGIGSPNGTPAAGHYSTQRVYLGIAGIGIQYGQSTYISANGAILGILTEDFVGAPELVEGTLFLGWIIMKSNETDSSNMIFVQANKLGGAGGDLGTVQE